MVECHSTYYLGFYDEFISISITMSRNCSFDVHINIYVKNVLICPGGF